MNIQFTGEYFVPGHSGDRIEADHMSRYEFAGSFAKGRSVLDVACGVGYGSRVLLDAGALRYEGVDLSEELVRYATTTYGGAHAHFAAGDVRTFRTGRRYDLITCFETIEHVEQYGAALRNLRHLIADNGTLLISSPNRTVTSPHARSLGDKPDNEWHVQEFTPSELVLALREAGFRVGLSDVYGQRLRKFPPHSLLGRVARRLFGNPDVVADASVLPLNSKVARYFVVVAAPEVFVPSETAEGRVPSVL